MREEKDYKETINMELPFANGRFVASYHKLNYQEVIDDFQNAKQIRILTYNISKNVLSDALLDALKNSRAHVEIITNIPNRMERYYNTPTGESMRKNARTNIHTYIQKLNPDSFPNEFHVFFNTDNHAKIIGTENIVYIGSANFSNESSDHIEAGVLVTDKEFIKKLYTVFFDGVKAKSLSYEDEFFSAFRLMTLRFREKFEAHCRRILDTLYADYDGKKVFNPDEAELSLDNMDELRCDLDELHYLVFAAEDAYDEEDTEYNEELAELIEGLNSLSIEWLISMISEDGPLWEMLRCDQERYALDQLQSEYAFEADEEHLDEYAEIAVNDAYNAYTDLCNAFETESDDFLKEIEKIVVVLKEAEAFSAKWKPKKTAVGLDNT